MSAKIMLACIAGAVAGAVFVLSCSDDAPGTADAAAVCDCPAAELPLEGRVVREELSTNPIPPGAVFSVSATCSVSGAVPLSGGCHLDDQVLANSGDLHLVESYQGATAWSCKWDNEGAVAAATTVVLTCLNPPPE